MTACGACGHDPGEVAAFGPLRTTTEPPAAYWHGTRLTNLQPAHLRILHALAEAGHDRAVDLRRATGQEMKTKTVNVHVGKLRRLLPDGLRVATVPWGYRLELEG